MHKDFIPCNLLIPKEELLNIWSVIACDQHTSEPEYWDTVDAITNDKPSAYHLIVPEAYLTANFDIDKKTDDINQCMSDYLSSDIFREFEKKFVIVERYLPSGKVRKGIVGALDLESYDYKRDSKSVIRATEGTVENRLPPRIKVRENAILEMPHIMVFIDDAEDLVMSTAVKGKRIYDFDLMMNGGHITGYLAENELQISESIGRLYDKALKYQEVGEELKDPFVFAIGDGNHSLAAAKAYWEELKQSLNQEELEKNPARYAMVEINNIHDDAIVFEPIHKVVFNTDEADFEDELCKYFKERKGRPFEIRTVGSSERSFIVHSETIGRLIDECEKFCEDYISRFGGYIDYIHNDDEALLLSRRKGNCGILLPKIDKEDLFHSIAASGPFPKKSFSIGTADEKRFYLECRKIK